MLTRMTTIITTKYQTVTRKQRVSMIAIPTNQKMRSILLLTKTMYATHNHTQSHECTHSLSEFRRVLLIVVERKGRSTDLEIDVRSRHVNERQTSITSKGSGGSVVLEQTVDEFHVEDSVSIAHDLHPATFDILVRDVRVRVTGKVGQRKVVVLVTVFTGPTQVTPVPGCKFCRTGQLNVWLGN